MHNNYHFLRQLTPNLELKLQNLAMMACWSQDKDELVFGFASKNKELFLKVTLQPSFACLFLTDTFERAKRNSVNLFDSLLDLKIISVRQFENERCFALVFEQNYTLVFKLFGNRSNLILFKENKVLDIFHNRLVEDNQLQLENFDRSLPQHFQDFTVNGGNALKTFPTFGKIVHQIIEEKKENDLMKKWEFIQTIKNQLDKPTYYLIRWQHQLHLSLLPIGEILKTFSDPIEALNAFYIGFAQTDALENEKAEALRRLQKIKKQTESYLDSAKREADKKSNAIKNEEIGHILMANLHQIPAKTNEVELFDFYREQNIKIVLKTYLSPQKNAENYYRKSKNEQIEENKRLENIILRETYLEKINNYFTEIEAITNLRTLRIIIKKNDILGSSQKQDPSEQFKKYDYEGFEIWVGRNAKNNDLLTKSGFKEDLWLHARDVSGSHVLIKHQAGKKYPNNVIEKAAQLAAWYSKRKTDSLTPVIVIPKKYVRKPKGLADGMVVLDKETVIMVQPMDFEVK